MGFPKGASIPFGRVRGKYPAREIPGLSNLAYVRYLPPRARTVQCRRMTLAHAVEQCYVAGST